jgi:hypothetical protein
VFRQGGLFLPIVILLLIPQLPGSKLFPLPEYNGRLYQPKAIPATFFLDKNGQTF